MAFAAPRLENYQDLIQKQITTEKVNNEQLKLLYETAFPKEEQIPWGDLVRLIDEMHLDFTAPAS